MCLRQYDRSALLVGHQEVKELRKHKWNYTVVGGRKTVVQVDLQRLRRLERPLWRRRAVEECFRFLDEAGGVFFCVGDSVEASCEESWEGRFRFFFFSSASKTGLSDSESSSDSSSSSGTATCKDCFSL